MPAILKGGDGYTFDVNTNIGGLMGRSRYSYNYAPIYNGDLLQNGGKKDCGCSSKVKVEDNLYNMLKQQGGFKTGGNQLDAIQYVSKSLSSLNMNAIISLIGLIFVYEIYTKNGKMHDTVKSGGSNISQIMAPLGRSNLIVLAALLLLHHFAVEMPENKKKSLKGGNDIETQITELLKPLGVDKNGASSLLTSIKQAFGFKNQNNHKITHKNENSKNDFTGGGSILKNIIAPLGTNAFIATGLLIILEKVFNVPSGYFLKK